MKNLDFDGARPIVEGKLYEYALLIDRFPGPTISRAFQDLTPRENSGSLQENWVAKNEQSFATAKTVEKVLKGLSADGKALVTMRYVERYRWQRIADELNLSDRTVYRLRDHVLAIFAYEFGLVKESPEQREEA